MLKPQVIFLETCCSARRPGGGYGYALVSSILGLAPGGHLSRPGDLACLTPRDVMHVSPVSAFKCSNRGSRSSWQWSRDHKRGSASHGGRQFGKGCFVSRLVGETRTDVIHACTRHTSFYKKTVRTRVGRLDGGDCCPYHLLGSSAAGDRSSLARERIHRSSLRPKPPMESLHIPVSHRKARVYMVNRPNREIKGER